MRPSSRRGLLAAAPVAPAALLGATAGAAGGELPALERRLLAIEPPLAAARRAIDEAEAAAARDLGLSAVRRHAAVRVGRFLCVSAGQVEALARQGEIGPAEAEAALAEYRRQRAEVEAVRGRAGLDALDRRRDALVAERDALLARIAGGPALGLGDVAVKLRRLAAGDTAGRGGELVRTALEGVERLMGRPT